MILIRFLILNWCSDVHVLILETDVLCCGGFCCRMARQPWCLQPCETVALWYIPFSEWGLTLKPKMRCLLCPIAASTKDRPHPTALFSLVKQNQWTINSLMGCPHHTCYLSHCHTSVIIFEINIICIERICALSDSWGCAESTASCAENISTVPILLTVMSYNGSFINERVLCFCSFCVQLCGGVSQHVHISECIHSLLIRLIHPARAARAQRGSTHVRALHSTLSMEQIFCDESSMGFWRHY